MVLNVLRTLPVVLTLAAVVFLFVSGGKFSPEDILSHSPSTPIFIVLFILILYALKSLSVFFPVIVLQVAVGLLFQSFWAVLLNIAGMAVAFALPYAIGYYSGAAMVTKLLDKHPKVADMIEKQRGSDFFISFFLSRFLSFLCHKSPTFPVLFLTPLFALCLKLQFPDLFYIFFSGCLNHSISQFLSMAVLVICFRIFLSFFK